MRQIAPHRTAERRERVKFEYSAETDSVILDARELASFARRKEGAPLFSPYSGSLPGDGRDDLALLSAFDGGDVVVAVRAVADLVADDGVAIDSVDAVKRSTVVIYGEKRKKQSAATVAKTNEAYCAVVAYLYAKQYGAVSLRVILALTDPDGETTLLSWETSRDALEKMFSALLARAVPFARVAARHGRAMPALSDVAFPFPSIREGQREFINAAYRAISSGSRLLVSAPTGIGKTMSALYPAVRAIGAGKADKVFCLCAKNVTGKAAAEAAARLSRLASELRSITIISKERSCAYRAEGFSALRCRRACPMTSALGGTSYEARRDAALLALLGGGPAYSPEDVAKAAAEFSVCPYELSLDLSEYCDVVVCDYNYVFDFQIRFRRYFERPSERYVFIIDEAHNLPKRGRDTYSASLDGRFLDAARSLVEATFPGDTEISGSLAALDEAFCEIGERCEKEAELADGETRFGFIRENALPLSLANAAAAFSRTLDMKMRAAAAVPRELERLDHELKKLVSVCELFDEKFTFFAESVDKKLTLSLLCLDPAELLDRAMSVAHASILFSATLSPIDYFADVCGCKNAATLELDSPYSPDDMLLVAVDSVKTTLSERDYTAEEVAELILTVAEGREGNYIAYFPSYAYLDKVAKVFRRMSDGITMVVQSQGMSRDERRAFLAAFENAGQGETKVGFCVLGGMFSEGIDLAGEKLIGAIIVGTGMGSITSGQNVLREYYDATREDGMAYAYVYPGFNNVLQAAGRVIRSENDRGVVVLIDERYGDPAIQKLFPKHWQHVRFTSDPFSLAELLDRFWEE